MAHNLSFTKASKELYVSQPAISKHIQELETEYSTRLFERMGTHITLTPDGELLLSHAEKILKQYKQLDFEMNLLTQRSTSESSVWEQAQRSLSMCFRPIWLHFNRNSNK